MSPQKTSAAPSEKPAQDKKPASAPGPAFADLGLLPELVANLAARSITQATPVQAGVIPLALEAGDLLAQARTGSGKTLAFLLPLAQRLASEGISRAWIVCPTRELAQQVAREAELLLGRGRSAVLVGGQPFGPQARALADRPSIVVGTPGRLCDHLGRGTLIPDADILVLDEADQMLDLGFRDDLERLVKDLGPEVARWCFSATFPPPVRAAVGAWLDEPRSLLLDVGSGASHVPQRYVVTRRGEERAALARLLHLLEPSRALVFVRTREDVDGAVRAIAAEGIEAAGISGDLTQDARERVLGRFRDGSLPVLVGTDVAARGIDVPGVSHVFNLGLPVGAESYTHRIGRTARAGADGEAWTVLQASERSRFLSLLHRARCRADEAPLPTAGALVAARRERLSRRVEEGLGAGLTLPAPFNTLAATHGAEAVLAVLVHRLVPDSLPEPEAPRRAPAGGPMQRIFVGLGRDDGASPGNIVALLCRARGVSGADLGRIVLAARHSLVEARPEVAELLTSTRHVHRGRPVPVRMDRMAGAH